MNKLELLEKLKEIDEVTLLELLDLTSEDLLDVFYERVSDRAQQIYKYISEQEEL